MGDRTRVGILFGGRSAEHEVSLQSAKSVVDAIDYDKYDVVLIGIGKDGQWYLSDESSFLLNADNPEQVALNTGGDRVLLTGGETAGQLVTVPDGKPAGTVDVIFPVLHGTFGEDGTVQGLLKLADIPFVGAGVLGSAAGMDKDVMKRLLRDADIPVGKFLVYTREQRDRIDYDETVRALGSPLFIKPCNLGSSVGVHKVSDFHAFAPAAKDAFRFDSKIIIEECITGREIECSVLGNEHPRASVPGEILPTHDFYSYQAKYIDEDGARLQIPADLPHHHVSEIQNLAVSTFRVLACEGMARVDFFLTENDEILVNEINTIPGFTKISMYPKLWEASGLPYRDLIDELIRLALDRHQRDSSLETSA